MKYTALSAYDKPHLIQIKAKSCRIFCSTSTKQLADIARLLRLKECCEVVDIDHAKACIVAPDDRYVHHCLFEIPQSADPRSCFQAIIKFIKEVES